MKKVIKLGSKVIVLLNNGTYLESNNISKDLLDKVKKAKSDNDILKLLDPEYRKKYNRITEINTIKSRVNHSKILSLKNDCIYLKGLSGLSMPENLANRILEAEKNNNKHLISTYKNFWILMSMNPSSECRNNLFWFLQKYGMTISKHGFFVAYRNVDRTKDKDIFTDYYTHSFKIKIGEMVTMDRNDCNPDSNITCSKGLHVAGKGWLKMNYYGNTGMACLVNPADVVAVPKDDNYGKLRTCAYLPMQIINYDMSGDVIPLDIEDGFDCGYISKVIYEGLIKESDSTYKLEMPKLPISNKKKIQKSLLEIASNCIKNRTL